MRSSEVLRVAVVIGSNREGRLGLTIAHWFLKQSPSSTGSMSTRSIWPIWICTPVSARIHHPSCARCSPRRGRRRIRFHHARVQPQLPRIDQELHRSARREWCGKAIGFVSYGGIAGGLRSVEALRLVFASLNAATVRNTVSFANAWDEFTDGVPADPDRRAAAADSLLQQINWWGRALRNARRDAALSSSPDQE